MSSLALYILYGLDWWFCFLVCVVWLFGLSRIDCCDLWFVVCWVASLLLRELGGLLVCLLVVGISKCFAFEWVYCFVV